MKEEIDPETAKILIEADKAKAALPLSERVRRIEAFLRWKFLEEWESFEEDSE